MDSLVKDGISKCVVRMVPFCLVDHIWMQKMCSCPCTVSRKRHVLGPPSRYEVIKSAICPAGFIFLGKKYFEHDALLVAELCHAWGRGGIDHQLAVCHYVLGKPARLETPLSPFALPLGCV